MTNFKLHHFANYDNCKKIAYLSPMQQFFLKKDVSHTTMWGVIKNLVI